MTVDKFSIRVGQDAYLSYTRRELDESLERIRKGKDGWTLAHDAVAGCVGGVLPLLIEAGGNLNAINKAQRTMLLQAAHWGELDIVDGLLTAGADGPEEGFGLLVWKTVRIVSRVRPEFVYRGLKECNRREDGI